MAFPAWGGAPPMLLLAGDDEWSSRSLESVLGPLGATVERAFTGVQTRQRALALRPDVVLVSAPLPDMPALDVVRDLRLHPRFPPVTPILVMTSVPARRSERLEALAAGAWDHVTLPTDAEMLVLRLRNFVAARRAALAASDPSLLDAGSGLFNERGLERRLHELVAGLPGAASPVACAVLEAEDAGIPSPVIDRLGVLLRRVGRSSDTIARTGPAQFTVVAPRTGAHGARQMMDRLLGAMQARWSDAQAGGRTLAVCAGHAASAAGQLADGDLRALLQRAREALEEARQGGTGAGVVALGGVAVS